MSSYATRLLASSLPPLLLSKTKTLSTRKLCISSYAPGSSSWNGISWNSDTLNTYSLLPSTSFTYCPYLPPPSTPPGSPRSVLHLRSWVEFLEQRILEFRYIKHILLVPLHKSRHTVPPPPPPPPGFSSLCITCKFTLTLQGRVLGMVYLWTQTHWTHIPCPPPPVSLYCSG